MNILKEKAKQSWSSDKIVVIVGSSVVATFSHSAGNGIGYDGALNIAQQFAISRNLFIDKSEP